ncbi:MAG: hypothetical protein JNJ99_01130 [Crocinitomicaceae bacterium]|nr:hypothetical protein [Crocinitomicaceae bacterium]
MFDRFTYKQKNYGLLVLFVLMLIVSYKRSLVLTLNAMEELKNQELQLASAATAQESIEMFRISIAHLNKNIGRSDLEPDKVNQEILGAISDFSLNHQVHLQKLESTHIFQTVDFTIYSNQISVEGNFNGILSLVYFMENEFEYARLTNLHFYTQIDLSTKNKKLYAKLLFQHYRQIN